MALARCSTSHIGLPLSETWPLLLWSKQKWLTAATRKAILCWTAELFVLLLATTERTPLPIVLSIKFDGVSRMHMHTCSNNNNRGQEGGCDWVLLWWWFNDMATDGERVLILFRYSSNNLNGDGGGRKDIIILCSSNQWWVSLLIFHVRKNELCINYKNKVAE